MPRMPPLQCEHTPAVCESWYISMDTKSLLFQDRHIATSPPPFFYSYTWIRCLVGNSWSIRVVGHSCGQICGESRIGGSERRRRSELTVSTGLLLRRSSDSELRVNWAGEPDPVNPETTRRCGDVWEKISSPSSSPEVLWPWKFKEISKFKKYVLFTKEPIIFQRNKKVSEI